MEGVINRVARLARLGYFCCLGLAILAIFTINPVSISGDEANATTGTATSANTSLSLTTNHDNAVVTITPNSANGTFAMSSAAGEAQFGVTTNNFTGYELSIVADDDSGSLTNTDGNIEHSIFSIDAPVNKSSFDTTAYNGKWGYKPSKYVSNNTVVDNTGDSAVFLPSPTTAGTILDRTTTANSSANNYSIALGVRADYNTYAGSYTKNFTLAAIANPTTYIIDYNKNTSDTVTNMPAAQASATSATNIVLANSTPERDGYNFLGWCTVQTADNTCSGTTYQPGDTYGIDQTTANTAMLYAMWQTSMPTIQGITLDTCPTEPMEVVDLRDGEVYTIQKLADGNCWLLDNLRLDLSTTRTLTTTNTNIASDWTAPTEITTWANAYSSPKIATSGSCLNDYCVNDPSNGLWNKNSSVNYDNGTGKIGVYYNYCAATAGTYCYQEQQIVYVGATSDICPKGWRMPTGGSSGEYRAIYTTYGNSANSRNALHTVFSGVFSSDTARVQGYRGNFWSSTRYESHSSIAYHLWVGSGLFEQDTASRDLGNSVRCVLDYLTTDYTVSYNKNTTDEVYNMPSAQISTINSLRKYVVLPNETPSRPGYYFLGWCDGQPTASNNVDSCPGLIVRPGDNYYVNTNSSSATFYATWAPYSRVIIQDITSSTCPTTPMQVVDSRDDEVYTIQKLADGKCWLLDNLRLDLTNPTVQSNLNESNTNATGVSLSYLMNGGGTSSDKYATNAVGDTWTSSNYSDPIVDTSLKYSIPSNGYYGKIGVYYSYCAASAGSYCYGNGASQGTSSGNATEDICPAGWRMPTGGYGDEYQTLYTAYSSNYNNFINALHLPLSGNRRPGFSSPTDQDSYGFFWSSTRYNNYSMYIQRIDTGSASRPYYERYYAFPVRCIIDSTTTGYTITYDRNTSDTVSNMPSVQAGTVNSVRTRATLSNSTPLRSGAVFLGWCSVQPTTSDGEDSCSGLIVRPGDSYYVNTSSPDIALYAMWRILPPLSIQSITSSTCTATPTRVYDARDYEIYTIQRLADGKCWLLDNLRLDLVDVSLSDLQGKTNASDTTLGYLKNGGGTTSDKYATSRVVKWGSSYSYSAPLFTTSGYCNSSSSCINSSTRRWDKDTLASYGSGSGKIGGYYNYCAASAGSYCYGNGTSSSASSGNATEDICPAGWRMPTGGTTGEYQTLYTTYSSDITSFRNALRAPFSGYFYDGYVYSQEQTGSPEGSFWSSTRNNNGQMYYLAIYTSGAWGQYRDRYYGYPIRCVLK